MPSYEFRNGSMVEVPDIVVSESGDLHDDVSRSLVIETGVSLTTHGILSGTVEVRGGATLIARGYVSGTVRVGARAGATFLTGMGGSLHVSRGGVATIGKDASSLGTMRVDGTLVNLGTRGISVNATGVVDDREGSAVRPPDETHEDGSFVYFG